MRLIYRSQSVNVKEMKAKEDDAGARWRLATIVRPRPTVDMHGMPLQQG